MIQKLALAFTLLVISLAPAGAQQPQQSVETEFDCSAFEPENGDGYRVTKRTIVVWAGNSFGMQPGETFNPDKFKATEGPQLSELMRERCKK
jgi:hypothetical protein